MVSDTKPCEFAVDELVSMQVQKEYSLVLTNSNDVLLVGNFANLMEDHKHEFKKLPFFSQMKVT